MTESILALIDEADKALSVPTSVMGGESFIIPIDLFKRMRNELSRLSVSPPPEEIARLVNWCEINRDREARLAREVSGAGEAAELYGKIAAALQRLAQEVERLKDRDATWEWAIRGKDKQIGELFNAAKEQGDEIDRLRARIAELEASLKVQAQEVDKLRARLNQTKALEVPAARAAHVAIMEVLDGDMDTHIAELEAALRAQAQEVEKLKIIVANHGITQLEKTEIMLAQKARIAELEAERDAIKAKTIEECMNLFCRTIDMRQAITYEAVVEKIRALSQEAGER